MRVFTSVLQNLLFVSGFSLCHHSGVCASRNPGMMQMYSSNYQPFTFKLTPNNLVNEFGKYLLNHDGSDTRIWYNFYNKRNVHWNQGLIYFRFQNDVGYLRDLYIPELHVISTKPWNIISVTTILLVCITKTVQVID